MFARLLLQWGKGRKYMGIDREEKFGELTGEPVLRRSKDT
jgi:hypothetical protein